MASRPRLRSPFDEISEPEEEHPPQIPPFFGNPHAEGPTFRPARQGVQSPNPMAAPGTPAAPWDFLTGSANTETAQNPITLLAGPPQQGRQTQQLPGTVGAGGGRGAGPARQPQTPSFLQPPEGAIGVDEYLAGGADQLQTIQQWNPLRDQAYIASVRREFFPPGQVINPIRAEAEFRAALRDPNRQREYQITTLRYDPAMRRMVRPAGFDPTSDADFLRASQQAGNRRRAQRESALEALYGPDWSRRQRQAELGEALSFFGGS
jgi:hypothetical protein